MLLMQLVPTAFEVASEELPTSQEGVKLSCKVANYKTKTNLCQLLYMSLLG